MHTQELPETSPILAFYDFEQPEPSGPDTFWIRQTGDGEVALSDAFRYRGKRSLHVSEVPDNHDFAEFLAYFRDTREGAVFVQYYLLLTDPAQRFNFGLAGDEWFLSSDKHGQAIWLQTDDGWFRHRAFGGWEDLFEPRPFSWYFIDLVYYVDRGTYDLAIYEEGLEEPVADLRAARAMHGHKESAVRYFSLIGDLEDTGRFDFFVDELIIATDPEVLQKPFVAPGRRRFFVDFLAVEPGLELSEKQTEDRLWWAQRALDEVGDEDVDFDLLALESAADLAFGVGELDLAESIYSRLAEMAYDPVRIDLKLADVRFLKGDLEGERALRESIYGRLDVE